MLSSRVIFQAGSGSRQPRPSNGSLPMPPNRDNALPIQFIATQGFATQCFTTYIHYNAILNTLQSFQCSISNVQCSMVNVQCRCRMVWHQRDSVQCLRPDCLSQSFVPQAFCILTSNTSFSSSPSPSPSPIHHHHHTEYCLLCNSAEHSTTRPFDHASLISASHQEKGKYFWSNTAKAYFDDYP